MNAGAEEVADKSPGGVVLKEANIFDDVEDVWSGCSDTPPPSMVNKGKTCSANIAGWRATSKCKHGAMLLPMVIRDSDPLLR